MSSLSTFSEIAPNEIISHIIDYCATRDESSDAAAERDRINTLKACSLTCKAFLPICRGYIFRDIDLEARADLNDRFVQLITNNPAIAEFVENLNHLILPSQSHATLLPTAFVWKHLTRLRTLSLTSADRYSSFDWLTADAAIQSSLLRLIHLKTLVRLGLGYIKNFKAEFLVPCSNLKELGLEGMEVTNDILLNFPANTDFQLNKLTLMNTVDLKSAMTLFSDRILGCDAPLPFFRNLKSICVSMYDLTLDITLAHELLDPKNIRSLEHLSFSVLELCPTVEFLGPTISRHLKTLKRLDFCILIEEDHDDPYVGLCQIFQGIAGKNRIEALEITLDIYGLDEPHMTGDAWQMLQQTLLAPGWHVLTQVTLKIGVISYLPSPDPKNEFINSLRRIAELHLQQLLLSKSLKFDFLVVEYLVYAP